MTMNVTSTSTPSGRQWERPTFSMPEMLDGRKLRPLGADRGATRHWYDFGGKYELAERPNLLDVTRDILPDGPILEEEPGMWRAFDVFAPGTFERLSAGIVREPKPPKPHRPVDALGLTWLAQPAPERIFAARSAGGFASDGRPLPLAVKPAVPPARGAASILARLTRAGATVTLSTDSQHLVMSCEGGTPGPGVVELVDAARPLLVAHLQGTPLPCVVTKHKAEAVTFAVGGAPWCGECGEAKP